jgi:hypothetical protein
MKPPDYPKGGYYPHLNGENHGPNTCFAHSRNKLPDMRVDHDDLWLRNHRGDWLAERPKRFHLDP